MAEEAHYLPVLACPHCGQPFRPAPHGIICPSGHAFDRAREGYVNLLPGGRLPSSSTAGDTAESLQARRRFLHAGWYQPIAQALQSALGTHSATLLDVGCGEGWYLSQANAEQKFGLDISKRAVQMASKFMADAQFIVGTAHRLPVLNESCDAVFTVFAPHSHSEYLRVLRPGGRWVTVTPGPQHLHEMRPKKDSSIEERERKRSEPPSEAHHAERVTFSLSLPNDAAHDLFSMTPLRWQTAADAAPVTSVTADVWVSWGPSL